MSQFFSGAGAFSPSVPVSSPSAYPYQVKQGDYAIIVRTPGSVTINLPANPTTGMRYLVKDGDGDSGSFPITINGNGHTIDDQATYTIQSNYGFAGFLYNGTGWSVINQ